MVHRQTPSGLDGDPVTDAAELVGDRWWEPARRVAVTLGLVGGTRHRGEAAPIGQVVAEGHLAGVVPDVRAGLPCFLESDDMVNLHLVLVGNGDAVVGGVPLASPRTRTALGWAGPGRGCPAAGPRLGCRTCCRPGRPGSRTGRGCSRRVLVGDRDRRQDREGVKLTRWRAGRRDAPREGYRITRGAPG